MLWKCPRSIYITKLMFLFGRLQFFFVRNPIGNLQLLVKNQQQQSSWEDFGNLVSIWECAAVDKRLEILSESTLTSHQYALTLTTKQRSSHKTGVPWWETHSEQHSPWYLMDTMTAKQTQSVTQITTWVGWESMSWVDFSDNLPIRWSWFCSVIDVGRAKNNQADHNLFLPSFAWI